MNPELERFRVARMSLDGYSPREYLTITELDTAARCARRYFYRCGVGLTPTTLALSNSAMFFGTCIHKAIGAYWNNFSLDEALNAFNVAWVSEPHIEDEKRNPECARMMLFSFASHHPAKGVGLYTPLPPPRTNVTIKEDEKISDWEIPFAIDIGVTTHDGRSLPLVGRIDGWCRSNSTGEVYLNEYKTSSEMSARFAGGFKRSPQVLGYTLAARTQVLYPVKGCFVEALKVSKSAWDTLPIPIDVPDFELVDFTKWARWIGQKIVECEAEGDWPKEPSGCSPYAMFGQPGYFCEFDSLCSSPDWSTMKSFFNIDRHVPFIMPTVGGKELK